MYTKDILLIFLDYDNTLEINIDIVKNIFINRRYIILESNGNLNLSKYSNSDIKIYTCGKINFDFLNKIKNQNNIIIITDASEFDNTNNKYNQMIIEEIKNIFYKFGPDSYIHYNFIENTNQINLDFDNIKKSFEWTTMQQKGNNVPRLVNIQYLQSDKGIPIYRHPIDTQPKAEPFGPISSYLAKLIKIKLGFNVNHVLVQFYRDGNDFIGEHSDKTLDILESTPIINISFGATRYFTLKDKITKNKIDIGLDSGSLFVLGQKTNDLYYHMIKQDKRESKLKTNKELDYNGERISFTFRCIGTWLNSNGLLEGIGAPIYTFETILNPPDDKIQMINAFSIENFQTNFNRNIYYSNGFYNYY